MIWFTSDLHLGHEGVIRFCARPYQSAGEMDNDLIRRWNNCVKHDDTVYVLGDVSFHKPSIGVPLLRRLHGRKILVQGNHDKYSLTQYLDAGFITVVQEAVIHMSGRHLRLSHFPYWPINETDTHELRYQDRRPHNDGRWLLCGHVHEKWKIRERQINVGVDVWNYAPVSQSQIEKILAAEGAQ